MTHQKRLSAPKHYPIKRKQNTYVSTIKGSRSSENAIPVVLFLRDVLEYADTEKEAKEIVRKGQILRNGEPVRDIKEGVGILDIIEIKETEEIYRGIRKGKYIEFIPVEDKRAFTKIVGKTVQDEDYVYRLHNGENYRTGDEYSTGNTLMFKDETVKELELEEGSEVLVIKGKHAGKTGELEEIERRGNEKSGKVTNGETFETNIENLVAIEEMEVE